MTKRRNLHWAAELERAGAHVTFGVQGLKTHAKLALVVRKEASGLRSYVHIGTGNYHVRTARLYADVGLFTCNPADYPRCGQSVSLLDRTFPKAACTELLVAPATMRPRLLELIKREIANKRANLPARIIAKMNQLEDPEMIEALCEAAAAGVPVDLIVRGFCCLRPGVPGRTEGIRVRSIIGRFLEHSRIFHFAAALGRSGPGRFLHRLGGLDVSQSLEARRGGHSGACQRSQGEVVGGPGYRVAGSPPSLDSPRRRHVLAIEI